jgi:hypothetical protein
MVQAQDKPGAKTGVHPLVAKIYDQPHILGNFLGYEKLGEVHSEWIRRCWGSSKDENELAHRGSYKTTAITIVGSIWYHFFKPNDSILLSRKTVTNSCDTLDEIAGHYRGPKIRELYRKTHDIENFKLRTDRRGKIVLPTKARDTKEGSVDCAGVDSPVTGQHYPKQLNDDLSTRKDRVSKAAREETRGYREEQENLRNPGGTIIDVGTMWHIEDYFHVKKKGKWVERQGLHKDPVGRIKTPGFTPAYIKHLKDTLTPAMYAAQYELKIISDQDRKFSEPRYVKWPEQVETVGYLDPAYGGDCTTALTLIGNWREAWYAVGFVWDQDATKMGKQLAEVMKKWKCGTCYVESNKDEGYAASELEKYHAAVTKKKESENKHVKIVTYAVRAWPLLNWCSFEDCPDEEYEAYMSQVLDYRENEKPNDAPDSLAALCRELDIEDEEGEDMMKRYA